MIRSDERVRFTVMGEALTLIDRLGAQMAIASRADVISMALALLAATQGHRILIEDDSGTLHELLFAPTERTPS